MGVYLNGKNAYGHFREAFSTYFVDKADILNEFVPILELKTRLVRKKRDITGQKP